jgi:succinate dehydrogenase / fumarate reductase iron-sulfur subunit
MKKKYLNIKLKLKRNKEFTLIKYKYKKRTYDERPMALDVLLQAQEEKYDDLAFRYGCRARNCGVCTIDINDRPKLACRARVKEGDILSAMATLPVIKDLVVKRDAITRQMKGYNNISNANDLNKDADKTYHNLTACIECYACLDGCPVHAKNNIVDIQNNVAYKYGNPYSFLKIQRLLIDPLTPESEKGTLIDKAKSLGLDIYRREYKNLKIKCGVGINLKGEVIKPLLDFAYGDAGEKEN